MHPRDVRRGELVGNVVPLRQDDVQIVPPHPSEPSCGSHRAGLGESGEPCETDAFTLRRPHISGEGELDTTAAIEDPSRANRGEKSAKTYYDRIRLGARIGPFARNSGG